MYRIWYSTESFADYVVDHTSLRNEPNLVKCRIYESDASKPRSFHAMPDHIRKILYLDACDLIVEKDNEPVFSIEITTEAGTGHNAFQRFARIAASAENLVPSFYIYPEGVIIKRNGAPPKWDVINPLIFRALDSVMSIYQIPALLYYFPTDIADYRNNPADAPCFPKKGLRYEENLARYSGCPEARSANMQGLFQAIDEVIGKTNELGIREARGRLLSDLIVRRQREFMHDQYAHYAGDRDPDSMSPLSAVRLIETRYLLNYLSMYEDENYRLGDMLRSREQTIIYQVNAKFRGDPYPGALAAIDYLKCREGRTYEDRRYNLVLLFGELIIDEQGGSIGIVDRKGSDIKDFFAAVQNASNHNLLVKDYADLANYEIPRYLMQVRYGSTYSKVKHIRVYSYFADTILFPNGALWRDA